MHPTQPFRITPFWIFLAGYLILTLLNYSFGYLNTLENRMRGNDPVYYYVYLHSLFFDGDLSFANNLFQFANKIPIPEPTSQGYHANYFSIGPAILWTPFFFLAHGLALLAPTLGFNWAADGWSPPYVITIYISNSLYALLGFWFTYRFLATLVTPKAALYATLVLQWASQMTFYIWPDQIMSHSASFAMAALCFWLWRKENIGLLTGWAAAWMILARWQNAILLLPIAIQSLLDLHHAARSGQLPDWFRRHALFALTFLLGVAPQMVAWFVLYGTPLTVPQGEGFLRFDDLHLWATLFDTNHGLFSWHPMLLAGLLGLLIQRHRHPALILSILGVLTLQWILNAAVIDWWAGWSFGHRRFDSVLPFFALGLALLYQHLAQQGNRLRPLLFLSLFFVAWNMIFIFQFKQALIPRDRIAPTWGQIIFEKFHIWDIWNGARHALTAIDNLKGAEINEFLENSRIAYEKAPNLSSALPLFSLRCMLMNDQLQGRVAISEWISRDKDLFLSKWILAELLVRAGEYDNASAVIPLDPTAPTFQQEVAKRILTRAPTLLDNSFIPQFVFYTNRLFYYY